MSNLDLSIVEVDGVEFYTDEATGRSGISQSGLAILCGINRSSISRLIKEILSENLPSKWLEPIMGKISECRTKTRSGMQLCNDTLSIAIIKHYAFSGNETAQYTFDKFAAIGFNSWIQSITGWSNPKAPMPKPELETTMPTPEEMDYLRSRDWEKKELEAIDAGETPNYRALRQEFGNKSGFGRAQQAVRTHKRKLKAWKQNQKRLQAGDS